MFKIFQLYRSLQIWFKIVILGTLDGSSSTQVMEWLPIGCILKMWIGFSFRKYVLKWRMEKGYSYPNKNFIYQRENASWLMKAKSKLMRRMGGILIRREILSHEQEAIVDIYWGSDYSWSLPGVSRRRTLSFANLRLLPAHLPHFASSWRAFRPHQ